MCDACAMWCDLLYNVFYQWLYYPWLQTLGLHTLDLVGIGTTSAVLCLWKNSAPEANDFGVAHL